MAPTPLGTSPNAKFFDATADSRATDGSLSARAHGHYSGPVVSYYDNARAAAVGAAPFSDTLTAAVPATYTDLSTKGFVRYQFTIDGNAKGVAQHLNARAAVEREGAALQIVRALSGMRSPSSSLGVAKLRECQRQ